MSCLVVNSSNQLKEMLAKIGNEISLSTFEFYTVDNMIIHKDIEVHLKHSNLILVDLIQMERTQALQLIEQLKVNTDAPILIMIDTETTSFLESTIEAGAFDYIIYPFDLPQLKVRLQIAWKYYEQLERQRNHELFLEKDLSIAKSLQKGALTPSLHRPSIQIDGFYITSNTLGGDMYCWFEISPHETAIILYDVMGHGVASSLITMSIRSLLRGMMTRLRDPELVINELNRHITELYKDEFTDSYLVTAIYMLINTKKKTISYINAGHPAGYLVDEELNHTKLNANTLILGLFPKLAIRKQEISYVKKQRIMLYTDGLQQSNEPIELQQFDAYVHHENAQDLKQFVDDNGFEDTPQLDDIAIVFVTVT